MAGIDGRRLLLMAALLLGVAALQGCMFLNAHFELKPDGAVDAMMEVGVLKEAMEGDMEAEITPPDDLEEGQWEEPVESERDEWHVTTLRGHAAPGERLFREGAEEVPEFTIERHLLTTVYGFNMPVKFESNVKQPVDVQPDQGGADDQQQGGEEMEQLGEMLGDLATVMAGEGAPFHFYCTLPGEIASTNGRMVGPGKVAWDVGLSGEGIPESKELQAASRLINWEVIGTVGTSLVEMGRDDLVQALIRGAQRGMVPDPVTDNPPGGEIDLPLYVQILDIMVALDNLVGETMSDRIMQRLQLNVDEPDRDVVAAIAKKVTAEDFAATLNEAAVDSLVNVLQAP